ncbi:hypothetical protein FNV43_RR12729 [Rhamnella rubrinervis]|uniref:Uncharacterized protein n=1 Tax=Rhamnella rubrinervis TaxID=2594499 RepID=A0A8K0H8H7_9ROSA|nr:hypothetical protein FNV43_RR12729 [Rhamnella rubrinervis]
MRRWRYNEIFREYWILAGVVAWCSHMGGGVAVNNDDVTLTSTWNGMEDVGLGGPSSLLGLLEEANKSGPRGFVSTLRMVMEGWGGSDLVGGGPYHHELRLGSSLSCTVDGGKYGVCHMYVR